MTEIIIPSTVSLSCSIFIYAHVYKKVHFKSLNIFKHIYNCKEMGDEIKRKPKTHVNGHYLRVTEMLYKIHRIQIKTED